MLYLIWSYWSYVIRNASGNRKLTLLIELSWNYVSISREKVKVTVRFLHFYKIVISLCLCCDNAGLLPDRVRRGCARGIWMEIGARRRVPSSAQRNAALRSPWIRCSSFLHDAGHVRYATLAFIDNFSWENVRCREWKVSITINDCSVRLSGFPLPG